MVNEEIFSDDLKSDITFFLEGLGESILAKIEASKDPLTFGYAKDGERFIIFVKPSMGDRGSWSVEIAFHSWPRLFKPTRQIAKFPIMLGAVDSSRNNARRTLARSLSKLSQATLRNIASSKEPLTFTLKDDHGRQQVEVEIDVRRGEAEPIIFID